MHKLLIAVATTTAILLSVSPTFEAAAAPAEGAGAFSSALKAMTPIKPAACQGWGPFCGPGYVRACGPYRCWCRPCR